MCFLIAGGDAQRSFVFGLGSAKTRYPENVNAFPKDIERPQEIAFWCSECTCQILNIKK